MFSTHVTVWGIFFITNTPENILTRNLRDTCSAMGYVRVRALCFCIRTKRKSKPDRQNSKFLICVLHWGTQLDFFHAEGLRSRCSRVGSCRTYFSMGAVLMGNHFEERVTLFVFYFSGEEPCYATWSPDTVFRLLWIYVILSTHRQTAASSQCSSQLRPTERNSYTPPPVDILTELEERSNVTRRGRPGPIHENATWR
jgi:hypothetical protein